MTIATFSSTFRFAFASGLVALTAGLFAAGCGSEASGNPGGEGAEQGSQAVTAAPTSAAPVEGVKRYPPHGYPCLGCHPCGGSYCDDFSNAVVCTGSGGPVTSAPTSSK